MGALGVLASCGSRDESVTWVFTKHDRSTRRGKIHRASFGKMRMREGKRRRLKAIRLGLRQPGQDFNVKQVGQPEPEHVWDLENLLENPMYYYPEAVRHYHKVAIEQEYTKLRQDGEWQRRMGKFGKHWAYKNWTPPGMEAKEPAPAGQPDDKPDSPPAE